MVIWDGTCLLTGNGVCVMKLSCRMINMNEVRSQKSEILFEHIYIYENVKHLYIYYFQTLKCIENIHV